MNNEEARLQAGLSTATDKNNDSGRRLPASTSRLRGRACECSGCDERFGGDFTHSLHRVGEHGVQEGARRRRCMTADEMVAAGLHLGARGWSRTFQNAPGTLQVPTFEPRSTR